MVAEEAFADVRDKEREKDEKKKAMDALLYSRTQKLFELWDANGDGTIDFHELHAGMRRYQIAARASIRRTSNEMQSC